ncbi:MAG: hypothetical protein A2010_06865 [Nitrospirae bacterium GWD2_57_9]|nr:MAG: hypothetical protein A2010_06865 [Nitrospirae bacterium GWD2_57_9]OGW46972.1 MAG: hypothetical protein A2078_11235 [Nitrospirae bacterium GWC2_57_9]
MTDFSFTRIARFFLPIVLLQLIACAPKLQNRPSSPDGTFLEHAWGVRMVSLRQSAEGYLLDFRYHVIDPDKASPLFDRSQKPYLLDQATGAKFLVPESPKVGALRTTRPPQKGKNYFIIFANPDRYVKKGSKVSVVIGEFKAENIVVE